MAEQLGSDLSETDTNNLLQPAVELLYRFVPLDVREKYLEAWNETLR